jgi:hypothetical protein
VMSAYASRDLAAHPTQHRCAAWHASGNCPEDRVAHSLGR